MARSRNGPHSPGKKALFVGLISLAFIWPTVLLIYQIKSRGKGASSSDELLVGVPDLLRQHNLEQEKDGSRPGAPLDTGKIKGGEGGAASERQLPAGDGVGGGDVDDDPDPKVRGRWGRKEAPPNLEAMTLGNFEKPVSSFIDLDDVHPGHMWVPVSVSFEPSSAHDPLVKMCELHIARYAEEPWSIPMGGLLNKVSKCEQLAEDHVRIVRLSTLERAIERSEVPVLKPSGFIFHETRCGSTLMSNMLATVPNNLVWSESTAPWKTLHQCTKCTQEQLVTILRGVMSAMGRTKAHEHLFFKLQSSENIEEYTKAFPDTPWIFLYRDPVEVLMSRLGAQRVGMEGLEDAIEAKLEKKRQDKERKNDNSPPRTTSEKRVAKLLADLCKKALAAQERTGMGKLIEYTQLPEVVYKHILPEHFGIPVSEQDLAQMQLATSKYSKVADLGKHTLKSGFQDDIKVKHDTASPAVKEMAQLYLNDLYKELQRQDEWAKEERSLIVSF